MLSVNYSPVSYLCFQETKSESYLQRLDLTAPTRLMGQRKVLKEGSVTKSKSGRSLNLYLFTDLLIFTETQGKSEVVYRWPVPLEECAIKDNKRKYSLGKKSGKSY